MKIALLIPSTSNGRDWKTIEESYLYKHTLKSFLLTYDKEHKYKFFIGIDRNDKIYDNNDNIKKIHRFVSVMINIELEFVYMDNIKKGHLTVMWNKLFETAYNQEYDYFFQCGDDIQFITSNWVQTCINKQQLNNNIGVTGPIDINNTRLLTQSFVSRKHMELFGYYFPPEIINWYCDDWINEIYKKMNKFYPLPDKVCKNMGGNPRYNINNKKYNSNDEFRKDHFNMKNMCNAIVERDFVKVNNNNNNNNNK